MLKESRMDRENAKIRALLDMNVEGLPEDGGKDFNRLIFTASPYLLQHADNPVDWYPWGDEAFDRAAREDKPVMVSIGYATCHWCHTMARESFEDHNVAEVINRYLIPVKVDREERPDIDSLYMASARILTGGATGWPLNIFLTPDRKPFYCATYIPKNSNNGVMGIVETVEKIAEVWSTRRELINENCEAVSKALNIPGEVISSHADHGRVLDTALASLQGMYDYVNGGFGNGAKFPLPLNLYFLLRMWLRTKNSDIEEIVALTLRAMRDGGICDQLGSGFHRYTVDTEWLVPHFEKMLYDQALIAIAYLEAYQAFGDEYLRATACELFTFILRELASSERGFYSGLGADSEGHEGRYYLWSPDEITEILGEEQGQLFCEAFGVSASGNFDGRSILHQPRAIAMLALQRGLDADELESLLESARSRLLEARSRRVLPFRDEKILTSWNGLTVAALARGAAVMDDTGFLEAARAAVAFIEKKLQTQDGQLLHSYYSGIASVPAFLDDYAFLCWGMIELYQADGDPVMLSKARKIASEMLEIFCDRESGAFYDVSSGSEQLPVRMKNGHDGAIPCGNSIACWCLLKLGKICGDEMLWSAGERCLNFWMGSLADQPVGHIQMINALDYYLGPDIEITLVGGREESGTRELLKAIHRYFIPGLVLRFTSGEGDGGSYAYTMLGGQPTAYVCARGACRQPVNSADELNQLLSDFV